MLIAVDLRCLKHISRIPSLPHESFIRINYLEQPEYHIKNTFPKVDQVYISVVDGTKNLLNDLENCCVNYGVPDKTPEVFVPVYTTKGKRRFLRWERIS